MDRLACVDVAAFPLQLLLRDHPDWIAQPVAVVENDRPQASVLFINTHARTLGVQVGQRYATALTLARNLHAGAISPARIDRGVRAITDRLRRYSPHVEPCSDLPGVFWLDASGLRHLYPSLRVWADLIRIDLQQEGIETTIAVGFSRFGTCALALSHRETVMCADAADERTRVQRVPLASLNLDPAARDRLLTLGIVTVGDFLRLPGKGIRVRFGAEVEALHQLAAGARWAPLVPVPAEVRHQRFVEFDTPESSIDRLLFVIKRHLDSMATSVSRRGEAIVEVELWMKLSDRTRRVESIKPAAATLDVAQLLVLVRLRLEAVQLSGGITTLRVSVQTDAALSGQRGLLPDRTRRDADAANRALARIRAECGDESVVRAVVRDAHLPAARFVWEPMPQVRDHASPRVVTLRPLVRRILAKARPVPEGCPIPANPQAVFTSAMAETPPPEELQGPYVISGGWWRGSVRRDYYFVRAPDGHLWWVYFDHRRRQFLLQGEVE